MEERQGWVAITFLCLLLLIAALALNLTLHPTAHITLPERESARETPEPHSPDLEGPVLQVEVTPQTVQAAVATLSRPDAYRRTVTVTRFWSGGSGVSQISCAVYWPWTRADCLQPDGQTRHVLTDGDRTYIWYDGETVFQAPAGDISADAEQAIPTYEELLSLPASAIVQADYRLWEETRCIYAETAEDEAGYVRRYWVSVSTGLLVAAEQLLEGELVYRMEAPTLEQKALTSESFTLPDGTVLQEVA